MTRANNDPILSIVVPVYNEQAGLRMFHQNLTAAVAKLALPYELIYCDDGSTDGSVSLLQAIVEEHSEVRLLALSRNFGKELAISAGLHVAKGQAIITLDADGQMPVTMIPAFVKEWQHGAKVVIGKRTGRHTSLLKRVGSRLFYGVFGRLTGISLEPDASDFRLIDRQVQVEFNRMTERGRITRGLIDWLGYERTYVGYHDNPRLAGSANYSLRKLFKLAIDSAISLSVSPLYVTAYIGAVILPLSTLLGLGMAINYFLSDPLHLHATGGAYLMVLVLFLVGILLVSQGIIGLYLSHIHTETQNRPLYVIDKEASKGISWNA